MKRFCDTAVCDTFYIQARKGDINKEKKIYICRLLAIASIFAHECRRMTMTPMTTSSSVRLNPPPRRASGRFMTMPFPFIAPRWGHGERAHSAHRSQRSAKRGRYASMTAIMRVAYRLVEVVMKTWWHPPLPTTMYAIVVAHVAMSTQKNANQWTPHPRRPCICPQVPLDRAGMRSWGNCSV